MAIPPIKKNDQVYILRGKDRGKTGRVLIVRPADEKVVVEGVQMIKRHTRPNPQRNVKGGIVEKEAPIHISNVAIMCKSCSKHTRIGKKVMSDGSTVRVCRRCGNPIE
jgi:large subunit ribosomal protein L24